MLYSRAAHHACQSTLTLSQVFARKLGTWYTRYRVHWIQHNPLESTRSEDHFNHSSLLHSRKNSHFHNSKVSLSAVLSTRLPGCLTQQLCRVLQRRNMQSTRSPSTKSPWSSLHGFWKCQTAHPKTSRHQLMGPSPQPMGSSPTPPMGLHPMGGRHR